MVVSATSDPGPPGKRPVSGTTPDSGGSEVVRGHATKDLPPVTVRVWFIIGYFPPLIEENKD